MMRVMKVDYKTQDWDMIVSIILIFYKFRICYIIFYNNDAERKDSYLLE